MKDHRPFPSPSAAPAAVRTAPEADDRLVPASSFQERIWLAERLEPDRPLYNVPMAWRLRGRADRSRSEPDRLEPDRLARALAALVERHEILRTRFVQRDGRLWQVVEPPWEPDVEWEDLRGLDDPERDRRLRSRLREVSHRRFDPASGRLLAVALFDLRDGEQALAVCIHHLVWDEGSTAVFLRDLAACYEAAGSEAARPREAVDEPARRGTRDDTARYPASPHQERMEFTDRFESGGVYPHAPLYHNLPLLLRLEEAPDPERLDAALERVEARHEALRTTVALTDRGVAQTVGPPSGTGAAWLDPEPAPGGLEPPPGLDEWLRKPFDLARGPLFRAAVQPDRSGRSGADGGAWLALVGHLAVVDRISLEVVAEELLTLLGAPDRTPAEADLPAGSRYGRWWSDRDHHLLARDVERVAERFAGKIEHSQGAGIAPLHLPQSRPRPAVHLYEEGAVELRLGPEVGLEPLARATDAGEEAVLLAGFAVLLALYSGQDELAIGTPFAARGRSEERLVGPVANLLPVPLRLSPGETFRALAGEVAAELAELRRHGRAPFDDVVRRIDPDKDMSRTPLFDVLFQCVDSPRTVAGARAVELGTGYGKYDLHLFVRRAAGGRSVRLLYNRLLFDHTRMRTLLDHYGRVLEQVAADPARTLARIDPLRPWERHAQRVEWNDTAASYPRTTVVELLREQARTRPDAVALTHDGSPAAVGGPAVVTYGALVRRAAEAAAGLVARGLRPGERVALRFERGIPQVEAILAVLFAGGSYVPVDPDSPDERIRFLLEDSGARFVVTDAAASTASTAATVLTSADLRRPGPAPSGSGLPVPPPEGLAYCIYTSGTTGRPKGVLVTHENLVRLIVNDRFPFAIGPDDVWTLFHSYAFDFSVWELFCCLARGGRAVVVDRDVARDAGRFRRLLPRERVSVLNQTPSAFAALMRAAGDGDEEEGEGHDRTFRSLRYLIFGGEALDPSTLARWHARHPWVRPVNMYGITEITVHATVQPLGMADMASGETASDASVIGRPIPTTTVSLLDVRGTGRLPPVGAVGEIHVGGAAVTRGYLDRPALEAARFVPAPDGAATLDGARRLFRSGDLARYRPDGTLEFLGRADDQVKIRGYRIEPGEIESRLREHPAVAEAAVLLETEPERALVAYVHPVAEPPPAAALRAHLARTLPEYMIPAGFRAVGTIPLTVNGKLDTRALRSLGRRLEDAPEGRPPATGTARALAELWSELLDAPSPGADDSFFELGGHSVLGARLVARIAERFGVELPLRHLFEHPRLQELADRIDAARASAGPEGGDPGGAAVGAGTEELLPASGFQQRLWLAERADPGGAVYTVPTVWRIRGRLDPEILRRALARVTGRHEILRTRFVERSGALHQAIGAPWTPELEREDLRGAGAGATRERLEERLRREAERRFDPASGRLFHAALVDLDGPGGRGGRDAPGGAEQALFLCFHHLVWDAGSAVPFLRDLARCYDAEARSDVGSDATLPPPGPQYRDFVRARRRRRESGGLTEGLEHWAEALRGAPSALPLPLPAEP
ncbi:MAG: amino acid adenylation domain-containing protein, partial [Acidobacteriota bacterium]